EKSFNEMYQEIIKKSEAELDDIMNVSLIDKMKDTAKKVMGRSVRTKDPLFWPSGMLMLGLLSAAKDRVIRPEIMSHISAHTDMWLRDYDGKIDFVDDALAGYCFVKSYEYTQEDKYKEAADKIADFIAKTPRDNDGSVIYNP
ncbi:glycoside hydrolase family 88 protein, partial [Escherichia coli]